MLAMLVALACGGPAGEGRQASPTPAPSAADSPVEPAGPREPGFVVWESNRSGAWRLWRADLDGRGAFQLSADEGGRRHCCPHISTDGSRIAYLSLPEGRQRYHDESALGELRLLSADGSSSRALVPEARTYFEHRAVVWVDERSLHYIADDGSVRRLDVDGGGESTVLEATGNLARRWIVDRTGRWAASGRAVLAPLAHLGLGEQTVLPGCQPYFARDGRQAYWTAGAGGPIDRYDLATGEASMIVGKNDPRLPVGRGYLYFPMVSADGTLLAFAASDGEHDHFQADYDLFLAETDPDTLEILGRPWPVAPHPAVDRFPDVWRPALELGRTVGEAPLAVELATGLGADAIWRLGAVEANGERLVRSVREAGRYAVSAVTPAGEEHGVLVVTEPSPPPAFEASWPVRRDGLLWWWSSEAAESSSPLESDGDPVPLGAPLPLAGRAAVALDTAGLLHEGLRRTNRLGVEARFTTPASPARGLAAIFSIGRDGGRENLLVGQRQNRLVMRMRVGSKREGPYAEVDIGRVGAGEKVHLALSYSPGRLTVFRDGERNRRRSDLHGHTFHWKPYPLVLGDRARGGADWRGELEALAIFDRTLDDEEVRANAAALAGDRP